MTWNCLALRAVQTFPFIFFFAHPCLCQQKISDTEKLLFDSVNRERA